MTPPFTQAPDEQAAEMSPDDAAPEAITTRPLASWPLVIVAWVAALAAIYFARDVLIPVVLAVLLTLLLRPALRQLRRLKLPDAVSALILYAGVTALLLGAVALLAGQAQGWLEQAPQTIERVRAMLPTQSGPLQNLEETTAAVEGLSRTGQTEEPVAVKVKTQDLAYTILGVSGHIAGAAVIVIVLGFFLLAFSDSLIRQAVSLQNSFGDRRNVVQLLLEVEGGISRYLGTITLINIGLGVATGLALWMLGIPNPVLWGALATVANFVPHVGAMACMIVLFFVGSVTHESLGYGLVVALAFMAVTSIESYFLTPLILSRSLQLSPLAVILAILFWGWLWGIAGGLMAAPLLTILKIVSDQFPGMSAVSGFVAGGAEGTKVNHRESSSIAADEHKRHSRSGLAIAGERRHTRRGTA